MSERKNILVSIITNPQSAIPLSLGISLTGVLRKGVPASGVRLRALGGTGGEVYALSSGFTMVPGMTINADGTCTGTPTSSGTFTFQAEVQDSSSTVAKKVFTLRVNGSLSILYGTPSNCELNANYPRYTLAVIGATGTVTWTIVGGSGSIPPGVTLSSAGVLSGIASSGSGAVAGIYYATARASDSGTGETIDVRLAIQVYATTNTPTGNLVPDNYVNSGYSGGRGDIPPIVRGEAWTAKWPLDAYCGGTLSLANAGTPSISVSFGAYVAAQGGYITTTLTAAQTAALSLGLNTISIVANDNFNGGIFSISVFVQVLTAPDTRQQAIQTQKAGVDVGTIGPYKLNFAGAGIASVTMSAGVITVTIAAGAGGVQGVTGTAPIVSSGGINPIISHAVGGAGTGTFDRVTIDVYGHATAGAYNFATAFSRSIATLSVYTSVDFASMTTLTDVVRLTGAAGGTATVRGLFASPRANQMVLCVNASSTTVTFNNQDASETSAAARFAIGANFAMAPDHSALFWYDSTSARWRIAGSY